MFSDSMKIDRRQKKERRKIALTIHFPDRRSEASRRVAADRRTGALSVRSKGPERRIGSEFDDRFSY